MFCRITFLICLLATQQPFAIRQLAVLPDAAGTDKSLARISADSQLLATGTGHGPVKLWDLRSGTLLANLHGTEEQSPRGFSPVDDRLLVSADLTSLSLYDLNNMSLKASVKLKEQLGNINFFDSFSPNGELFIVDSVGKNKVTVWETKTARMIAWRPCNKPLFSSTFSPDSRTVLMSCGDRNAILWDARTGNVLAEFQHREDVLTAKFDSNGKTITTITLDNHVTAWDISTSTMKNSWGRDSQVYSATFSPDGKVLATLSWGGFAMVWDVETQRLKYQLRISRNATSVTFSRDGKFVSSNGHAGEVAVWNVADGSEVLRLSEHREDIQFVQFSADSRFMISSGHGALNIWDLARRAHIAKLDANFGLLSDNGQRLITQRDNNSLILWELGP